MVVHLYVGGVGVLVSTYSNSSMWVSFSRVSIFFQIFTRQAPQFRLCGQSHGSAGLREMVKFSKKFIHEG